MGYREVLGGKDGIGGPNQANLKMEFCNKTVYTIEQLQWRRIPSERWIRGEMKCDKHLLLDAPSLFLRNYWCVSRKIMCTVSRIMRGGNLTPWCIG